MSNGMELQVLDVKSQAVFLGQQQERLEKWCVGGEVKSDALVRHALAEMEVDHKLRSCTPTSIYLSLLACAVTGLVPGKLKGYAFLVPFQNSYDDKKVMEATFMIGWRGVKHQGFRVGIDMKSAVIHRGDLFDYDVGTHAFVKYKAATEGGGPVIGTAAWAQLPRGGLEVEYMNLETLGKIEQAANRGRQSPAWNGPFKDQMQRKSALRRLGKQIEMGEDFFKGQALEQALDDKSSMAAALDEFTDGEATRVLGKQSVEAAAFAGVPRPAAVQVPAKVIEATATPAAPAAKATAPAASPSKPAITVATASSGGAKPTKFDDAKAKVEAKAEVKASPTAGAAGSTAKPSEASAAASSPAASTTAAPATSEATPEPSSASGGPGPDDAFGGFGDEDPVDSKPAVLSGREGWIAQFRAWGAAHPTRDSVLTDDGWEPLMQGWADACKSKKEMEVDKQVFKEWANLLNKTDDQAVKMQKIFATRYKAVP